MSEGSDLDILALPSRRDMIRAAVSPICGSGNGEQVDVVVGVELEGDVAHQLDMLLLVLADRDVGRLVEQDVGGLQDRVGVEADADALAVLARFLLELGHPVEPAHPRRAGEQPGHFGMGGDARLVEQQRLVGIDAAGDQGGGHAVDVGAQLGRVVVDGDRVQIGEEDQASPTSSCILTQRRIAPR